ncbi:MAG: FdhF/YdeP family oxidoreductase [Pseudomonadota bacterium]
MSKAGGGFRKIGYTLATARKAGIAKTGKALRSKNTCKACAFGMGGQLGGMTNEAGEFPSVCNKSVQAQSTDVQPAINDTALTRPLTELAALSAHDLEHLGRLATPLHKAAGHNHFMPLSWSSATSLAAQRLANTAPDRSFFYASGRSSNEAGFVFQLLARCYGTNHVNNCSYYCHQATGVALSRTIGTGTATIELEDLDHTDMIFVIGANPASNHPRFIHKLAACRERGGRVVVINPAKERGLVRFAVPKSPRSLLRGGTDIASDYLQPNIGTDAILLAGLAKATMAMDASDQRFIDQHTTNSDAWMAEVAAMSWADITATTGIAQSDIEAVAAHYAGAKQVVFAWGMGVTHHLHGVENIEAISNLALLRGMIGRRGAGLLPLRGHSNVQGIGTIGVKPVLGDTVLERLQDFFGIATPTAPGYDTMGAMQAAARGAIDTAVLLGGNLLSANPKRDWAETALNRINTRIALTTTLNASHVNIDDDAELIVLPVCARDEEWESTTQESMFNFVRLSDGQITRHETVRPEVAVLVDIANALLPDSPVDFDAFRQHRNIREAIAAIVPGMAALKDIDVARREFHIANRLLHEPTFNTSNGKAAFRLKTVIKPEASAHRFRLATVRSEGQFNSIIYEESDTYRDTRTRWCVMMNVDDAKDAGINEGDAVTLVSDFGEMREVAVYVRDLPRGNLMAYYPEANVLTGTMVDPASRTPAFKNTPVSLHSLQR